MQDNKNMFLGEMIGTFMLVFIGCRRRCLPGLYPGSDSRRDPGRACLYQGRGARDAEDRKGLTGILPHAYRSGAVPR